MSRNSPVGHDVSTAQQMGWGGISNGELLHRGEQGGFDLLIVADKNLRYQQNLKGRKLAILELWTNHRPTLEKHLDRIKIAAERISPGEYVALESLLIRLELSPLNPRFVPQKAPFVIAHSSFNRDWCFILPCRKPVNLP